MLLELKDITKEYVLDKNKSFKALKNINLKFDSSGLVCIKGKSGSGKSTLLGLIALLDKPTNGKIIFNGEDIQNYKEKEICFYRQHHIGMLFQQYNLIEDETVLYNIMLPCLIAGQSNKASEADAIELLEKIEFPKDYYQKKVSELSGGEKQRVSLLRSLIMSPSILLCDEPTGALDSNNSKMVMDILKKVGHRRLVILVSHNDELIKKYADRIIEIKDGEVINDVIKLNEDNGKPVEKEKHLLKSNFTKHFSTKNFKKRIKRNIFSLLALSISLTAVLLSIGFSDHANKSLLDASLKQFDLGVSQVSKESKTAIPGSSLSLSQVSRLNADEIKNLKTINSEFIYDFNYSYFVPISLSISFNGIAISDISYNPIYSYKGEYVDSSLISSGSIPKKDSLKEVIINQSAYEKIQEITNDEPLFMTFSLSYSVDVLFNDENGKEIYDVFTYNQKVEVVGVVEESSFMLTPKIYYSYLGLKDNLSTYTLSNISSYLNNEYTVYDLIENSSNYDLITSYSHYAFLNNVKHYTYIKDMVLMDNTISFTNNAYNKYDALIKFADAISLGLIIFLIISIAGAVLIFGIINYSSYSQDLKESAIITSLGARKEDITTIYINESLVIGFLSFLVSFIFAFILSKIINLIVFNLTRFKDMIEIPFLKYKGINFSLPLMCFLIIVLISTLSTYIPIAVSKRIPVKKELESND